MTQADGDRVPGGPAALRNREPIRGVLAPLLDDPAAPPGAVVETAAGDGIHACYFAPLFPARPWLPTERDPRRVAAIEARMAASSQDGGPSPNLLAPQILDMTDPGWADAAARALVEAGGGPVAAMLNVNMIHIAPWAATLGLLDGAGRLLEPGGVLLFYGPFRIGGAHTGPGNEVFDARLRAQDPAWGIRDLDEVTRAAASHDLRREAVVTMPSDNRTIVFRRGS